MGNVPSKYDDVIDSRDVIERFEALSEERYDLMYDVCSAEDAYNMIDGEVSDTDANDDEFPALEARLNEAWEALESARAALVEWDAENGEERAILEKICEEGEGCADWRHGETMIHDDYFRDYAEELAGDIGAINPDASWPNNCIDWERAARELQMDYSAIDFDGVTYWVRS